MISDEYILINKKIAPEVFIGVLEVKQILLTEKAKNVSDAVRRVGISRSAYYKYKDYVFSYNNSGDKNVTTIYALLKDKAGVFFEVTSLLYRLGANILTINQSMPVDGAASVYITISTDLITESVDNILEQLNKLNGIISTKVVKLGE